MIEDSKNFGSKRMALMIDGDNAQPSLIEDMIVETSKYGMITIRRIYGDWTEVNMSGWKDKLQTYAIQPIQQFRYTTGKNATDSAMIIDAMDTLYTGGVDGFCLVSSDSDYTRLATRIREKGFFVMGIGKKNTPRAFVNACDVFVYTENLGPAENISKRKKPSKTTSDNSDHVPPDPIPLLKNAFDIAVQEDGWAFLGTMGHHLRQIDPGFDSRTYGYRQLSQLIRAYPKIFKTKDVKSQDGTLVIYITVIE